MRLILALFFFFSGAVWQLTLGQNLVPNPSFEDTVACPYTPNQLNYAEFWYSPTQGSPDYFNSCDETIWGMNVPYTGFGYQLARTGNAFAGVYAFQKGTPNFREYVQIRLADTLIMGHEYLVSFYLNLTNWSKYSVSSIGAYFSASPVSSTNTNVLSFIPQIQNTSLVQLSDSINWMLISDTLFAGGTEEYITIGNFHIDSLSDTTYYSQIIGGNYAYYYIDDVSVIDVESLGLPEYGKKQPLSLYPNPSNGKVYLSGFVASDRLGIVEVSDITGKVISKQQYPVKSGIIELNLNLTNGVYFVKCISNEISYDIQKIIVGK